MKYILALFCCCVLAFGTHAYAQDLQLERATLSSGRSVFTTGLSSVASFTNGHNSLSLRASNDLTEVVYTYPWGSTVDIASTFGLLENAPWFGPEIIYHPNESFSAAVWLGGSLGAPDDPRFELEYSFLFGSVAYEFHRITFQMCALSFMDDPPAYLPGISYAIPISDRIEGWIGGDYNTLTDEPLLHMGMSYAFLE